LVPFLALCVRDWLFWLFSGLDLAPWQKVDMATLAPTPAQVRCHRFPARLTFCIMRHFHETESKTISAYVVWLKQPDTSSEVVNVTYVTR